MPNHSERLVPMTTAHHQPYLARALADGHAEIVGEGRNERIHYIAAATRSGGLTLRRKSAPSCGRNWSTSTNMTRS